MGQADEAAACCRRALAINPQHAQSLNLLGNILKDQKRLPEAIDCYERALRVDPRFCDALSNLGLALKDQGQVAEAIRLYRQALDIKPDHAIAHNNLAIALTAQGEFAAAAAGFEHALLLKPDYASARWNRALLKLLHGDFLGAWPDFECRWRLSGFVLAGHTERPLWDGTPLEGKTILLYAEQGLGDTIQFVRYVPLVRQRGGTILIECQSSLVRLVAEIVGTDNVFPTGAPLPPFDVRIPLLSLPGLFRTELATVPADVPYLHADPHLVEHWAQELASTNGFKIGIAWQGSPTHEDDRNRSVPLGSFEPLAHLPRFLLVSVQVGSGTQQLENGPFAVTDIGARFDHSSFDDLAAALIHEPRPGRRHGGHRGRALGWGTRSAGLGCVALCSRLALATGASGFPVVSDDAAISPVSVRELGRDVLRAWLEGSCELSLIQLSRHPTLSPRTRGERVGVRGPVSLAIIRRFCTRPVPPHPCPSPPSTGERGIQRCGFSRT